MTASESLFDELSTGEVLGPAKWPWIEKMEVERLFGHYSYAVGPVSWEPSGPHRTMLLYGDNGCGKTTLLRLAFRLLSADTNVGHRTWVAKTPFRRFSVILGNGDKISAVRPEGELVGRYRVEVHRSEALHKSFDIRVSGSGSVGAFENPDSIPALEEFLKGLRLRMLLVPSDRVLQSSPMTLLGPQRRAMRVSFDSPDEWFETHAAHEPREAWQVVDVLGEALNFALATMTSSIRRVALRSSTRADKDANSTVAEIVSRLSSEGLTTDEKPETLRSRAIQRLEEVERRGREFAQFGIAPAFKQEALINVLKAASEDRLVLLDRVVGIHLEAIERKLAALRDLLEALQAYQKYLSEMFIHKRVSVRTDQGVHVRSEFRGVLQPHDLSSGERHLLLLLSTVLGMFGGDASVVLIDEPEISLNVKWQRSFIEALLECSRGSRMQFVMATHSIELISEYGRDLMPIRPLVEK